MILVSDFFCPPRAKYEFPTQGVRVIWGYLAVTNCINGSSGLT